MSNPVEANHISENINMKELRGRSMNSSRNMSRVLLNHSDISSISYVERIEAQSNNIFWFNQTELENFQLPYVSPNEGISLNQDKTHSSFYSSSIHVEGEMSLSNASNQQHGLGTSLIPYSNSEPADPDL